MTRSSDQTELARPRDGAENEAKAFVLQAANQLDVKFVRLWFTDIVGTLKGFAITVDELDHVLSSGASFDGATIDGLARSHESLTVALPDPTSWQVLAWRPSENAVASMFCDLFTPEGQPLPTDGRHILRRVMQKARARGFTFYVAPELEFFYADSRDAFYADKGLRSAGTSQQIDVESSRSAYYFDQSGNDITGAELRRRVVLALESMGIPVKHSHHEAAYGQHEIDLRHDNALTMADSVMTYRVVVREVSNAMGGFATFMPRPFGDRNGSAMHTHLSLFSGDTNAFYDANDPLHLSESAHQFIAGLVKHAAEITAITNQWVNSYKRLVPGLEAPVNVSWPTGEMGELIRVPPFRLGQEASLRVEYRAPDAACNPYLTFAAILAAGMRGIEQEYDHREIARDSTGQMPLPRTLQEAVEIANRSELLTTEIGTEAMEQFVRNKMLEWEEFSRAVTDYETRKYLSVV